MKTILLLLAINAACVAQQYPRWFLDPGALRCGGTASGFAKNYFLKVSSDSIAYLDGCKNLTMDHFMKIDGGEAFWATEAGNYWMGNDFKVSIDTAFYRQSVRSCKRLCRFSDGNITIVLVSEDSCQVSQPMRSLEECPSDRPRWVDSPPQKNGYIYDEGVSPDYFYESSSWESAEKQARFNLAKDLRSTVEAIGKLNGRSGQSVSNENVSAELRNIRIMRRWRDIRDGLYYVLARVPIR